MREVLELIGKEKQRQQETLMLIPSENYTYPEVRRVVGSVLMHKYAEGYPGRRYYQGMEFVDQIESLAIQRAKDLFGVPFTNVQPYSGSSANMAVYLALLEPGEAILGLKLASGGHLTHGHPKITFSGRYFKSVQYEIKKKGDEWFDFEEIEKLALEHKPKLIVVGTTAFPRILNWEKFAHIADQVGAYLLADISHIAGLVAGGVHPSPVPFAHVVTTTTHKTLRGPRGALILVTEKGIAKDPDLPLKIDKAIFPGLQGGPHLHTIAGIAIALEKAKSKDFKEYAARVVKNARVLAGRLKTLGFELVTGGTDNHLMVVDLRKMGVDGKGAAVMLEESGIVVNANTVPNDPGSALKPSGIRLGTPAVTTRGMREREMELIADLIFEVIERKESVKEKVKTLCKRFKIDLK